MYVVYFHSVGNEKNKGFIRFLSVSVNLFERFCAYINRCNIQTWYLNDWYDYQMKNNNKSKKHLVLTFDDGYLDNWVYVYPILKKYGLTGTIFVNPEFVDPGTAMRPNLEDVGFDSSKLVDEDTVGFLNWAEIEAMHASGLIDIQSHSMSHNFYFRANKIIDIYEGQERLSWMPLVSKMEEKSYYLSDDFDRASAYGYPVFEFGRALALRRYLPDERIFEAGAYFLQQGLNKQDIINELEKQLQQYPGSYETETEMEERYRYELFESKKILEKRLDKKVEFLCWPGGGFNSLSVKLSEEAGYKASTLGSGLSEKLIDNSMAYKRIPRFGLGSVIKLNNEIYHVKDKNYLIQTYKAQTGNLPLKAALKIRRELLRKINNHLPV